MEETFEKITNISKKPKKSKFQYFDNWLKKYINLLYSENNYKNKKNYKKFKRGTIVYIDYGVAIGEEFSKIHLSIVLNKNDHSKNKTLTVIPLSSKNFGNHCELKESIYDALMIEYSYYLRLLRLSLNQLTAGAAYVNRGPSEIHKSIKVQAEMASLDITQEELYEFMYYMLEVDIKNKEEKEFSGKEFLKAILGEIDKIKKEFELITKKYENNAFAIVEKITTVSKDRIVEDRVGKYSPLNNAVVSDEVLNKIDSEIIRLFTK